MDNYLELSNTSLKQDGSDYMPLGPALLSSSANTWQQRKEERGGGEGGQGSKINK